MSAAIPLGTPTMRPAHAILVLLLIASSAPAQPKRPDIVVPVNHFDNISAFAFSADGRFILSGSMDGSVVLWDADTCDVLRQFGRLLHGVDAVTFSHNGKNVV